MSGRRDSSAEPPLRQMKPVVEECDLRVHSVIKSQQELGLQIEHLTCGPPPLPLLATVLLSNRRPSEPLVASC